MILDEQVVKIFKALGHPIRLKIIKSLLNETKCVCELNNNIEFSQSNLSQHLKILKEAGIVKSTKVGTNIHYTIACEAIAELLDVTENIATDYFKNLK
ncbi:ArsR/SmtB family transcription factor [Caldicellulosiruptoraceae bacterium PP1]